jgi:hypothetical protein
MLTTRAHNSRRAGRVWTLHPCRGMATRPLAPLLVVLLLLPASTPAPVVAQTDSTRFDRFWGGDYDGPRRIEVAAAAGYALSTDWSDRVALQVLDAQGGVHQQVLLRNVAVAPGASVAGSFTYWRGRHGFRVSVGHSRSCLTTSSRCDGTDDPPADGDAALAVAEVPLDVWRYGVEGLVGLRNWEDSRLWRPYAVVGAGGVTYDPGGRSLALVPGSFETVIERGDGQGVVITHGHTTFLVATSELGLEHVFGLTLGAGMDVRVPIGIAGVGLRLELVDQITSSPFSVRVARLDDGGRRYPAYRDDVVFRSNAVHNLRLTAGLLIEFGLPGPRTEYDPGLRR